MTGSGRRSGPDRTMQTIATDRLVLRRFRPADAADLFAYLREPSASCFLAMRLADLAEAATEATRRASRAEEIAIALREGGDSPGRLIGDLFAVPEDGGTYAVGWNLNPAFGGRGYAFEATQALFADLFERRGARRLYAYVEDHNLASQRLCEKLGMRREGLFLAFVTFRNDEHGRPVYENTMQYALLATEWAARRQEGCSVRTTGAGAG